MAVINFADESKRVLRSRFPNISKQELHTLLKMADKNVKISQGRDAEVHDFYSFAAEYGLRMQLEYLEDGFVEQARRNILSMFGSHSLTAALLLAKGYPIEALREIRIGKRDGNYTPDSAAVNINIYSVLAERFANIDGISLVVANEGKRQIIGDMAKFDNLSFLEQALSFLSDYSADMNLISNASERYLDCFESQMGSDNPIVPVSMNSTAIYFRNFPQHWNRAKRLMRRYSEKISTRMPYIQARGYLERVNKNMKHIDNAEFENIREIDEDLLKEGYSKLDEMLVELDVTNLELETEGMSTTENPWLMMELLYACKPYSHDALEQVGLFLENIGQFHMAVDVHKEALEIEPRSILSNASIARCCHYLLTDDPDLVEYKNPMRDAIRAIERNSEGIKTLDESVAIIVYNTLRQYYSHHEENFHACDQIKAEVLRDFASGDLDDPLELEKFLRAPYGSTKTSGMTQEEKNLVSSIAFSYIKEGHKIANMGYGTLERHDNETIRDMIRLANRSSKD